MFDFSKEDPTRRRVLWITPIALGCVGLIWFRRNVLSPEVLPGSETGAQVSVVKFNDQGQSLGEVTIPKVVRADADWFGRLTPQQYYVTRKASTDTPFTGTYYQLHQAGLFRCICCGNACSARRTNTIPARAGPPSPRRSPKKMYAPWRAWFRRSTSALRCYARSATRTWGTSSMTVRHPPRCAIASTNRHCDLFRLDGFFAPISFQASVRCAPKSSSSMAASSTPTHPFTPT